MTERRIRKRLAAIIVLAAPLAAQARDAQKSFNEERSECYRIEADHRLARCASARPDDVAACHARLAEGREACLSRASARLDAAVSLAKFRAQENAERERLRAQGSNQPR